MKSMMFSAATAAGILMAASAGDAADLPMKAPPLAPAAFSWTGFYLGAHAGWGWLDNDATAVTNATIFPTGYVFTPTRADGILGGGQLGYNYQLGQVVLGLEGDFSALDVGGCNRSFGVVGGFYSDGCLKTKWTADVAGRLGWAWDRWLVYAKGGVAWADFEGNSTTFSAAGAVNSRNTGGETRVGYVIGGGLEYAFWNNWSVKVEYDFLDFGTENVNRFSTAVPSGVVSTLVRSYDTQVQQVKIGVNYRFDWAAPVVAKY